MNKKLLSTVLVLGTVMLMSGNAAAQSYPDVTFEQSFEIAVNKDAPFDYSPDSSQVAVYDDNEERVEIYDTENYNLQFSVSPATVEPCVAWSEEALVIGDNNNGFIAYDDQGNQIASGSSVAGCNTATLDQANEKVFLGRSGEVLEVDLNDFSSTTHNVQTAGEIPHLAVNNDGSRIFIGGQYEENNLLLDGNFNQIASYGGRYQELISDSAFLPGTQKAIAAWSREGEFRIYDSSGTQVNTISSSEPEGVTTSTNYLVTTSVTDLEFRDPDTYNTVETFTEAQGGSVAKDPGFSNDGSKLAFYDNDGIIYFYDIDVFSAPEVQTLNADNIGVESAQLNGNITLNDASSADAYFNYRVNGTSSWTETSSVNLSSSQEYSKTLSGLQSDTTYEFEAVANYTEGQSKGSINTFTTNDNFAPTANFSYTPQQPDEGQSISFDASNSSDPDGTIQTYEWDWDNDGTYEDSGETTSHTYSSPGTKTVVLRVTDDMSAQDTVSKTVDVQDATPPQISNGDITDQENGNDIVRDGDQVEITVDVTDASNLDYVNATAFGQEYILTSQTGDTYGTTTTVPDVSDGSKDLQLEASDINGNNNTLTVVNAITVDNTAPTINSFNTPNGVQGEVITITADITEETTTVVSPEVSVFGQTTSLTQGSGSSYTAQIRIPYSQNTGEYTATLTTEDEEGNSVTQQSTITVSEGDFAYGTDTLQKNTWGDITYVIGAGTKSIKVELEGASGGNFAEYIAGSGGYTVGNLTNYQEGDELVIEVGEGGEGLADNDDSSSYGGGAAGSYSEFGAGSGGGQLHR